MIRSRPRLHYGWIVAAVTFLVLLVGAGVRATPGVLILPLEQEFGWSNATISSAVAINLLLYGLMGPFAVAIMERFGLRRTVVAALVMLTVGVGLTAAMRSVWQLQFLWGLVVGVATGMVSMVFGATVAERWFSHHRGLVIGALTASSATGQLIFLPVIALMVDRLGWRSVSVAIAVTTLALVPLVLVLLRDRPGDLGLPPVGGDVVEPARKLHQNPVRRAFQGLAAGLRSRDFWLLGGSFFVCGASTNGLIGTHLIPACGDHGIPEVKAAGLLAMMGIFDLIGTTGSGWLTDRVDSRKLLCGYYGLRGLSLLFLPFALQNVSPGLPLFAIFYGLDWVATVPPTIRLAEGAFGKQNAALMFGWIAAMHQMGSATAAWTAGLLRSGTGSYLDAFLFAGVLCLMASIMVLMVGRDHHGIANVSLAKA